MNLCSNNVWKKKPVGLELAENEMVLKNNVGKKCGALFFSSHRRWAWVCARRRSSAPILSPTLRTNERTTLLLLLLLHLNQPRQRWRQDDKIRKRGKKPNQSKPDDEDPGGGAAAAGKRGEHVCNEERRAVCVCLLKVSCCGGGCSSCLHLRLSALNAVPFWQRWPTLYWPHWRWAFQTKFTRAREIFVRLDTNPIRTSFSVKPLFSSLLSSGAFKKCTSV